MTNGLVLVVDTATRQPTLALAHEDGTLVAARSWPSRHRHGEQLLSELDALLAELSVGTEQLRGIIVGTGPGSFTGLRIGLATAKVLSYSLELPLVGVSTTAALAAAARNTSGTVDVAVTLPAGAADRYFTLYSVSDEGVAELEQPRLVGGPDEPGNLPAQALLVAVELEPPIVPEDAVEHGRAALAGLGASLARLGTRRLSRGDLDDVATLVPAYVALPRGITKAAEEMAWLPDPR